jgi:hypothetical protein
MHTTDHADPDDPTTMALPVIGDRVQLTDGDEGTVVARSQARPLSWRVQDGDPEHGVGWSRWVELHEIAGYPDDVAWVRVQFQPPPAPQEVCPRCAGTNGRHGMVHQRYGNGWGRNTHCPNTPVEPGITTRPDPAPDQAPAELPADELVAGVLNAAMDWHAATQAGSFLDHCLASDALHAAVRAYLPVVGR